MCFFASRVRYSETNEIDTGELYARADALWFMFDRSKQRPIVAPEEEWAPYAPQEAPRLDMPKTQHKLRINPALIPQAAEKIIV